MSALQKVCVTGASGFVGKALCRALYKINFEVHAICRKMDDELLALGANVHIIDIVKNPELLGKVFEGADAVFHVAAKVDMWGDYQEFFDTNVVGTRNVIKACKETGIRKLIYTSSPSVVADGTNLRNIDESYPIPQKHHAAYPATKAIAEREVLQNNCSTLKTAALRPHLIFGPGDNHFIPTIVERAKKGRLVIVGEGSNLVDVCFIEDCVKAHLCALSALDKDSGAAGKAFFISQGQPIMLWQFINKVLIAHGLSEITRKIPKSIALALASIFETVAKISPFKIKPLFTKFLVSEMSTDHYFNISAAANYLGYTPQYSLEEAMGKSFPAVN